MEAFEKICHQLRKEIRDHYVRKVDQNDFEREMVLIKDRVLIAEALTKDSINKIKEVENGNSKFAAKTEVDEKVANLIKKIKNVKADSSSDKIDPEILSRIQDGVAKIQKFDERMTTFQIEIKTVEKCMREDIESLQKFKLDTFAGKQIQMEVEDLRK